MLTCSCGNVLLSPIHLCVNGHSACDLCGRKLPKCYQCKGKWTKSTNKLLEDLMDQMWLPCKFREEGCDCIVQGNVFKDHLVHCDFRPVICNLESCMEKEVPFRFYVAHLGTEHAISGESHVNYISDNAVLFSHMSNELSEGWNLVPISLYGENFFVNQKVVDGQWYLWLTMQGGRNDAAKYRVKICLMSQAAILPGTIVSWTLLMHSFRHKFEDLKECSIMTMRVDALGKLCHKDYRDEAGNLHKYRWEARASIIPNSSA